MPGAQVDEEASLPKDEYELMQRLLTDHAGAAFDILFRRYNTKVYRQAMHLLNSEAEAEEVVQEVFLTVYEKASTFRGDAAFSTWLYRLTANAALGRLRHRRRHPEVTMEDYLPSFAEDGHHRVRPVVDWTSALEDCVAQAQARQLLRQAIDALPPLDKAVVVLSDLEELSNQEIGDILELSVSAVKSRLHRARLYLRGQLAASLGRSSA